MRASYADTQRRELAVLAHLTAASFLAGVFTVWALVPVTLLLGILAYKLGCHLRLERERPPDWNGAPCAVVTSFRPDHYLIGYHHDTGEPLWLSHERACTHLAALGATGSGKTLWMLGLFWQQAAQGGGCTFFDAKRDADILAQVRAIAEATGRTEDLIVIDPLRPELGSYNPFAPCVRQRPEVKARKALRTALPLTTDFVSSKHYDRLAHDAVSRVVRALEAVPLAWTVEDLAVAMGSFPTAYPIIRQTLLAHQRDEDLRDLEALANTYRGPRGAFDTQAIQDNLRGVAAEFYALAASYGRLLCTEHSDLVMTEAIKARKLVYLVTPRLEDAENSARLVRMIREDLEVSIGEIISAGYRLESPHLVLIDEAACTFGPTWASLFELSRKGRFAFVFGAQSTGALKDPASGLSQEFFERVMANVGTKIALRLGDEQSARDMSGWFGERDTVRRSRSVATMRGLGMSAARPIDLNAGLFTSRSRVDGESEDRRSIVHPEDLTHGLANERGVAWVDMGGGRIEKARLFWADVRPGKPIAPVRLERYSTPEPWALAGRVRRAIAQSERSGDTPPVVQEPGARAVVSAVSPAPPEPLAPKGPLKLDGEPPRRGRRRIGNVMRLRMRP